METVESSSRTFPNDECRVNALSDIESFAECNAPTPQFCPHERLFANGKLCHHPQWRDLPTVD